MTAWIRSHRAPSFVFVFLLACAISLGVFWLAGSTVAGFIVGVAGTAVGFAALVLVAGGDTNGSRLDSADLKELKSLLALTPEIAAHLNSVEGVAESLFVCHSDAGLGLGFAVNHSGTLVCASAIGEVRKVKNVRTGQTTSAISHERQRMLQAVSINAETRGLVPAYRTQPNLGESLWAWDAEGTRCSMQVDSVHLTAKVADGEDGFMVTDGFMAKFDGHNQLIGGPVMTQRNEVIGVAVGASSSGHIIVQPWASLEQCIDMNAVSL